MVYLKQAPVTIYRSVGQPNIVNGEPVFRAIATVIDWKALKLDPQVIAENSARIAARFEPCWTLHEEPAAIVAYGPSLRRTWELLKDWQGPIFTCSGAHRFLFEHGITPNYHVECDPRAYKADLLGPPSEFVTYLIASLCHPRYFDALVGYKVLLWHLFFSEPEIYALIPSGNRIITSAGTVGSRAMIMALLLGYTDHHFFGFDAADGHAGDHPNTPNNLEPYKFGGQTYMTNHNWIYQAELMLQELDSLPQVKYKFYGTGLLQEMARQHIPVKRSQWPLGIMKP